MEVFTLLFLIVGLLFAHFVADFICQNDYVAINKSKYLPVLALHVVIYAVVLAAASATLGSVLGTLAVGNFFLFLGINSLSHFLVDFFTSRANSYLWKANRHWFFCMIGFDQFLHAAILVLTVPLLL